MTYAAHCKDFATFVDHEAPGTRHAAAKKTGVLRRVLEALRDSRQQQADRQIAAFIDRPARWLARERIGRSIAHLDDRLLADVGLCPRDLGLGERLIRRYAAGGGIWAVDKAH
jgi:hypothetical protein